MSTDSPVTVLSDSESWDLLRAHKVGRLAFHLGDEVHITPVNFGVDASNRIVFRTAEGSKLLGVTMNRDVAFEIDEWSDDEAASVVVRGLVEHLEGADEQMFDDLGLHSWVDTVKYHPMGIVVNELTGRRFQITQSAD